MSDLPPIIGTVPPVPAQPVGTRERIELLDILRGIALFGILTVNMAIFSQAMAMTIMKLHEWTNPLDVLVSTLIAYFFEGKFIAMFSFLFGLGLAIQQSRADANGVDFTRIYMRRLAVLLSFGAIHALFIWEGDILVIYAVCGFVLFFFRNASLGTILIAACIFMGLEVVGYGGIGILMLLGRMIPQARSEIEREISTEVSTSLKDAAETVQAYAHGTWPEIFMRRAESVVEFYTIAPFFVPMVMCLFLLGLWVGRRGILSNICENRLQLKRVLILGLGVGAFCNLAVVVAAEAPTTVMGYALALLAMAPGAIGGLAFGAAYVSGIALLFQKPEWHQRLRYLAPVGRMALTNYILESVICTTIFYNYGLGLFGKLGPAASFCITIAVYATLIPWSHWWLARFEFGPLEWLWRTLTYGKAMPMRRLTVI